MRRSTRRATQYILIALAIVIIGPYVLKKVSNHGSSLDKSHGLPREPGLSNTNIKIDDWQVRLINVIHNYSI